MKTETAEKKTKSVLKKHGCTRFDSLVEDYRKYLIDNKITNEASSKSYRSYLKNLLLELFGKNYDDIDFKNAVNPSPLFDLGSLKSQTVPYYTSIFM